MGLFGAYSFLNASNQPMATRIGAAIFASVFAMIGAGLIFGSFYGYSRQKKQSEIELANPGSPWLWRPDWSAGRVESRNKASAIGWWVAAMLVNMLSLPMALISLSQGLSTLNPAFIVPVAFELVGLLLLFAAIRATIRFERFGKTYFEMNARPFSPGGRLAGAIHVQLNTDAPHGVDLQLSCIRRIATGSGEDRSTHNLPLWEDSRNIPGASLQRGPLDTRIPVEFTLPPDAYQTNHDNHDDQVLWLLRAKADVPGVDYSDEFEVPVFRTDSSPAATLSGDRQLGSFGRDSIVANETASEVPEPARHRVIVEESPDGLQFRFPAGRNVARTALIVSLAIAISTLLYGMLRMHPRPPFFAFAVVAVLDFFLLLAAIRAAISATRIVVGNGVISWRRAVLGIGKKYEVAVPDVDSIVAFTSVQQASYSGSLYSLRLKSKSGKSFTMIDDIESRQEARWIISLIEKRVGLRLSAQVQIQDSFYGPPPQPGFPSRGRGSFLGGPGATGPTGNNLSIVVGAIFFVAWLSFVLFMILRPHSTRAGRFAGNTASGNAGSAAGRAPHFVRSAASKRATLDKVLTWGPQQQAEELMARAVEHAAAAMQAIPSHSSDWAGHLQLTENLRQLGGRARYSSDLRARRAEADVQLALDGWTKTPETVDELIRLAKSDPASRPSALYCLGILAGDGIAADRAHRELLSYARTHPDAVTRQWAVEGLQFVGSDATLDELFQIFTHDPSFAVRDRAACNLADCGIFTRQQRLRLVPRLIDLVSDPQANPQMLSWSYVALRDITGEKLPDDSAAWRGWYGEHGSAKATEFAQLDWWQVRGDN
jgi:hypothetical protein